MEDRISNLWKKMGMRYKSHPWHGIDAGSKSPVEVNVYVEVVPSDTVKYEVDKNYGYLKIDRPQKFSNIMPTLYGFVPQTYCADKVAQFCMEKSGKEGIVGDYDPLDICVLTEREVTHGDILVKAIPIGGFRMIDGGEADDKILAVLKDDSMYGSYKDIEELPEAVVRRLKHYFLTYKGIPGEDKPKVEIPQVYGREEAMEVIRHSREDYLNEFGTIESDLAVEAMRTFMKVEESKR